ncbi:3'-5' exonuclease [Tepidibacillus fermentans]|uniref:DNA polymerase-3 subunit epsilon n=1 Tax=Tepidibacillus fermentans TaxID=1281767 RepID=A0A4R3KGJ0_9BACI|nr:exonuclease domain-containing protein [Tepidibacillus fermentans]TCS82536.1 DNA polymerase-3 subunit epsilon [Tepidibacillus fermentans]
MALLKKNHQLFHEIQPLLIPKKEMVDPDHRLKEIEYVVFDTETTGFHPYAGDQIIAIGAVKLVRGQITETFHTYVNPLREVPKEIETLTGITNQQLKDQPLILDAIYQFLQFAYQSYLVAHGADFDLHFLNIALKKHTGLKIRHPIIDTMNIAFHLLPRLDSHHLDRLLEFYQIPIVDRHTALGDAKMTAKLFQCLLQQLEEKGISTVGALKRSMPSVCRQAPYLKF